MKIITFLLVLAICLTSLGCGSKDEELLSFLKEWDEYTDEITIKINTGNIDEARKVFEGKKEKLKTKLKAAMITEVSKISVDTRKKYEETSLKIRYKMMFVYLNRKSKFGNDPAKLEQVTALLREYGEAFGFAFSDIM